jgi:hypothetical protein
MGEETVAAHEAAVAAQIADAKEPKVATRYALVIYAKPSPDFLGGTLKGKRWLKTRKHAINNRRR